MPPAVTDPRVDLVLHIGSGKTGTSSVQQFLGVNRPVLAERGLVYPRSPGRFRHTRFGLFVTSDAALAARPAWRRLGASSPTEFRREFARTLLDEVGASGAARVLISDEALYGAPPRALGRLRAFADAHAGRVRVVCYLRRQDEHVASRYQQVVKVGEVRRLADRTRAVDQSATYDYARRLDTWARWIEPSELVVRRFEQDGFHDGSLHSDFLLAAGIDAPLEAFQAVPRQNESLDAESVEFLRILNLHRARRGGAGAGSVDNRRWARRLAAARSGPTLTLPAAVLDAFMARWEDGNRVVAQRHLADPEGVLFRTPRRREETTERQYLDPDRLDHFLEVTRLPERLHRPMRELVGREARHPWT